MADGSLLFQLAIAYLYKVALPRTRYLKLLVTALLFGPLSLFGLLAGALLPKNEDLFLDQLVVAETVP